MCFLTKLHCNCCHKFCIDYMLEYCDSAKECDEIECHYTNGSFCKFCEENCRDKVRELACEPLQFPYRKIIEDKTDQIKQLTNNANILSDYLFYPNNPAPEFGLHIRPNN